MLSPLTPATFSRNPSPAADGRSPAKIRDAAQQFEALLIGQMLRAVRESGGWMGTSDPSGDCATEYAEQQFAAVISQRGGLGLSDLIARGLDRESSTR